MHGIQELHEDYNDKVLFFLISSGAFEKTSNFNENRVTILSYIGHCVCLEVQPVSIPIRNVIDAKGYTIVEKSDTVGQNWNKIRNLLSQLIEESI